MTPKGSLKSWGAGTCWTLLPSPCPAHPIHPTASGAPILGVEGWEFHRPPPHDGGDNLFSQLQAKMLSVLKPLQSFPFFPLGHH